METKELGNGVLMLQFEDAAQPVFLEKKGKPYVYYGEKNDYPNYLLYLFNNSAKHSAIINGKVDYICGKGWEYDKNTPDTAAASFIQKANAKGESLDEVTGKATLDLEIFNGAYLQIVWNRLGKIASIYHLDYTTVRSNAEGTEFYVSEEWVKCDKEGNYKTNNNPKYDTYPAFNPTVGGRKSQILYLKKYHPGIDIYTLPIYRGSITWIEVDVEVGNYHLNNVKGGFFANKLINFNNGNPSEEEQKKIETKFKAKFGGVRGQKWILAFNADATKAATVLDLNVSESDKLFDQLNKTTQQEIFTGHRITSPMLFGIKTEGQLGGRTEMRESYEAFQNIYVNGRQQWLEKVFNMLAGYKDVKSALTIQRSEPISFEFSESVQEKAMTQDEIREKIGLPAIEKNESNSAQDTINAINSLSPLVANRVLENLTPDELRALIGFSPAPPGSIPPPSTSQFSTEDDMRDVEVFSDFGTSRSSFRIIRSKDVQFASDADEAEHFAAEVTDLSKIQGDILDVLAKDPLAPVDKIAKALRVEAPLVTETINELVKMDLLTVKETSKGTQRTPSKNAKATVKERPRSVQILYSYEGPKDSKNRPFCAKMLELDRLYSRKEIEAISARLGYSVWTRRGGWYTIPNSSPAKHRPFCRHSWASNVVVKED